MDSIVAVIRHILNTKNSFLEIEEQLLQQTSALVCDALEKELEALDWAICKDAGVKILRRDQRTITTLFGILTFKRRLVETTDGMHVYLLDKQLGLSARQRESAYLVEAVASLGTRGTYRAVAQSISILTPVSMSHQKVGNILRRAGVQTDEVRKTEASVIEDETITKRQVPTLYVTGDAFILRSRPKGMTDVYRLQVNEGVIKNGKRSKLLNRHLISSTNREEAFHELEAYLAQNYDLTNTLVLTSSDNGSGFEPDKFQDILGIAGKQEHVLDSYHLNRKLKERLAWLTCKKLFTKLRNAVYGAHWDQVDACLDTIEALQEDQDSPQKLDHLADVQHLRDYLRRNWGSIKPFGDKELKDKLHCLGSCETNHRRYTYRMKHQGRSWGPKGTLAMVRLIDCEQNGNLRQSLRMGGINDETVTNELKLSLGRLTKSVPVKHEGVVHGLVACDAATSSSIGQLAKIFA